MMMHPQHKVPAAVPSATASTSQVMPPVSRQRPNDHWRTFDPLTGPPPRQSGMKNQ